METINTTEGILALVVFLYLGSAIIRACYWLFFYQPKIAGKYWKPKELYLGIQIISSVIWPVTSYLDRKIKKDSKIQAFYDEIYK